MEGDDAPPWCSGSGYSFSSRGAPRICKKEGLGYVQKSDASTTGWILYEDLLVGTARGGGIHTSVGDNGIFPNFVLRIMGSFHEKLSSNISVE